MTIKQDTAINELVENRGIPVGTAMVKAGYSRASAKNPKNLTNSKAYKQKLGALAKANNVTLNQYMMNLGLGMTAMKQNNFTGEITEDIGTRLAANKQAERFIFKGKEQEPNSITADDLKALAEESDEVKLSELVFKRNT